MTTKNYGFCYDKQGNLKTVSTPFYAITKNPIYEDEEEGVILIPVKKPSKTKTGKLHASVGFPGFKN